MRESHVKHSYHYAFYPINAETKYSDLLTVQRDLEDNILYSFKNSPINELVSISLIRLSNENIVLSIIKVAENDDGIVVRLYNASDFAQTTKINLGFDVKEIFFAKLNEEKKEAISDCSEVEISFKPWEILTVLVKKQ